MKNILSYVEKEDVIILSNGIIAYSTFIGVLSAIIYYIADKETSIWVAQTIVIIYILAFIVVINRILKIIKRNKNEE